MTKLRLSPSGPVVGEINLMPLRVVEDVQTLAAALVLTGANQDVDPLLRVSLAGPIEALHYFSAECELDISNDSTNVLAQVTLTVQVSYDGGAFAGVDGATFNIGSNAADALRQIRPGNLHVTPRLAAAWSAPAGAELMEVRVVAVMTAGEAGNVQIEASDAWLRLTDHSAAA